MYCAAYGLFGMFVGRLLNLVIERAPARESLLRAPVRCAWCGRRLSAWEKIPMFGYLISRGRCRTCGVPFPAHTPWVELASGVLFACLWAVREPGPTLALDTVYCCILLVVAVIDLKHKLIPNVIVLPAVVLALLAIPLQRLLSPPPFSHYSFLLLFPGGTWENLSFAQLSAISQLLGGGIAFSLFLLIWIITPNGMGAGDVKLAAFIGLITAFPGALVAVLGSFVLGGVVSLALLLSGAAGRKSSIPFGPFLAIAAFSVMIFGDKLLRWYLGYLVGYGSG